MANTPALVVLTLLQLCRAEISDILPEPWYSANVINDGFQPKSISEIFTTESSFSSTNPIIILPKSSKPGEMMLFPTLAPSPLTGSESSTLTDVTNVSVTPSSPSTAPPTSPTESTILQAVETSYPSTPFLSRDQTKTQLLQQSQAQQSQLQQLRFEVLPIAQSQPVPAQPVPQTSIPVQTNPPPLNPAQVSATREPLSNYFLIYQQAPQSIQGFAPPATITGPSSQAFDSPDPSRPEVYPTSPLFPFAPSTTAAPFAISTTQPPISSSLPPISSSYLPPSTDRTVSIPASTQTFSTARITSTPTRITLCPNPGQYVASVTTPNPNLSLSGVPYPLRIRVVAPTGSITNVNINPATTTTRRPTTTRAKRPKPKRNSYDRCINSCKGNNEPICTIPLGSTPIDPQTLKGFPSVCHMACHNSYRRQPYEKVLDGRCGRLRTRIQSFGSKNKLTREELNKAQYTVESTGPQTIVEFSGSFR